LLHNDWPVFFSNLSVIILKNKRLAHIVKACRDISGKELFQYLDAGRASSSVDSGMVNDSIKEGTDFSAKDFRTWAGSLSLLISLKSLMQSVTEINFKRTLYWRLAW